MRNADKERHADKSEVGDTQFDNLVSGAVRSIEGIPGYTISAEGIPRKGDNLVPILKSNCGLPIIFTNGLQRFLDEVVAHAFLGPPPCPMRGATVVHFDGDDWNCAVTNIAWRVDPDWLEYATQAEVEDWMRPDHRQVMVVRVPPGGMKPPHPPRMVFF
jgi:hypothetical protein